MFRRGRLSSVKRKKEGMPGGAPLHPFFLFCLCSAPL